eukprot:357649-Chlamydomonas_euryale.AAC.1
MGALLNAAPPSQPHTSAWFPPTPLPYQTRSIKATRMGALLNAALGYVSDRADGFIDFDAVPDDGASMQVCGRSKQGQGGRAGGREGRVGEQAGWC